MKNIEIAIGWTLIYSLWQAGVAAVALAGLFRIVRSSAVRYALGCAALLMIVAAFVATLFHFFPLAQDGAGSPFGFRVRDPREFAIPLGTGDSIQFSLEHALPWITPLWLIGVAIFNLRHLVNWLATRRMRSRGICAAPDIWQDRVHRAAARLRVSKSVMLLESCLVQVPIVIGQIRPVILFPVGLLAGLPAGQIELILMHELAHIRRWDYAVNMVQTFIEGLMFYNPAVWWISNVIRNEREHCCDDIVATATRDVQAYAAALTALEELRSNRAELALAATGGSLLKRIDRLLRPSHVPGIGWVALVSAGILITAAAVVAGPLLRLPTVVSSAPAEVTAAASTRPAPTPVGTTQASTALMKWLNEDVAYIITNEERAAFNNLKSEEERAQFIINFWRRRDPTPGTMQNEFQEEHYRRIGEANQKFTTPEGLPGWKTDRGRTYIMWGKPDEIESHPAGGIYNRPAKDGGGTTSTFPFEIWLYRYIEGIGNNVLLEFVDMGSTGDFRLTVDPAEKRRLGLQK